MHARHYLLSREWPFPWKGLPGSPKHVQEIDRFFGCLEDPGDSPPAPAATPETTSPSSRNFFSAIEDDGNGWPPFVDLWFPQLWGLKLTLHLQRILHFMLDQARHRS